MRLSKKIDKKILYERLSEATFRLRQKSSPAGFLPALHPLDIEASFPAPEDAAQGSPPTAVFEQKRLTLITSYSEGILLNNNTINKIDFY